MDASPLILITSQDCHLCAHARQVLAALGVVAREIDAGSDEAAELAARGVPLAFLPVLVSGTHVLAYGRLSERALRGRLAA